MATHGSAGVSAHTWSRRVCTAAIVFTILGSGAYALHFGVRVRYLLDEAHYLAIAQNLSHGHGFSITGQDPTAFRAPLYPVLLGLFRFLGVSVTGLRLVNVLLLAGTVWLAWSLATRLGGPTAGALAAAATALYPLQVYTASAFFPETLATTLLLASLWCFVRADAVADARAARPTMVLGGLALALLALTVPLLVVVAPVTVGWYLWRHGRSAARGVALAVVVFALPLAAWTVRNAVQMKAFIPLTTGSGFNLLLGNSEHTTVGSGVDININPYLAVAASRHLNEVGQDRYFRSAAISYIEHHPLQSFGRWVGKTLHYFSPTNALHSHAESSPFRDLVAIMTFFPMLLLLAALLSLARRWPFSAAERLMVAIFLLMAPVMGVFFTRVRFRLPLDEVLIVVLSVGVARVLAAREAPSIVPVSARQPSPAGGAGAR